MEKLGKLLLIVLALALWLTLASRSSVMKAAGGCKNTSLKGAYATAIDKQTATFINVTTGAVGAGTLLKQQRED